MPRRKPAWRQYGQVDFSSMIPFDDVPQAGALSVNDLLVMRRAAGGPNVIVTVGDIQAHGGSVDIADLTGGNNTEMLVKLAGVWTATPDVTWNTAELSVNGHITTRLAGAGELRNIDAATGPTLLPRNDRTRSGWGASSGSENMRLFLDLDVICTWFHTGAAGNDVQWSWNVLAVKTASTTQTQGSGGLNGNRFTNVNVVANPDDVVTMPNVGTGVQMVIFNTGANRLQIFPASGDQFQGEAVDASITLEVNGTLVVHSLSATIWQIVSKTGDVVSAFPEFQFFADQMQNPVTADWAVNALAPAVADSINSGISTRQFDDTTEEGIGFILEVPAGATNIVLDFKSRAQVAPPAARTVGLNLYNRGLPDNVGVEAWSAGTQLTDIDIPNNNLYQDDSQTITLASLGITAGEITQFELTRIAPTGGTNLVGDWNCMLVRVSFS